MSLNRLFEAVERARDTAQWRAAFGDAQEVKGRTIIPVAQVSYGFGLGFGRGMVGQQAETSGEDQAGGGVGAAVRPLGVMVVSGNEVTFEETLDATRISLAGIVLGGLVVVQVATTIQALLRRR